MNVNGKQTELFNELLTGVYEPFFRIKQKLADEFFPVSFVLEFLGISRKQLAYWDSMTLRVGKKRGDKRAWRRFSILDIFNFWVVRDLLHIGIDMAGCELIIQDLRSSVYDNPFVIYFLGIGEPVFLIADVEGGMMNVSVGTEDFLRYYRTVHGMVRPNIIIPMHNILLDVLDKTRADDFYIETKRDDSKSQLRVIFYVDGEAIEFSDSDRVIINKLKMVSEFLYSDKELSRLAEICGYRLSGNSGEGLNQTLPASE